MSRLPSTLTAIQPLALDVPLFPVIIASNGFGVFDLRANENVVGVPIEWSHHGFIHQQDLFRLGIKIHALLGILLIGSLLKKLSELIEVRVGTGRIFSFRG